MQYIQTNINTVHAALTDSYWGFKECASVVPDSRLREKFEKISLERERMLRELEIRGGATKSTTGSVKGSLTRTWTKIKSSISSGVQHVLEDLAAEEASLKKTYDNALKSSACDSALNGLLFMHLRNIECHLSELRIICGEAKYGNKWDVSTPSTGEVIKEKLQTTGATLKGKMQTTGETISTKFSTSGTVIKNKLGLGQNNQQQQNIETVNLDDTTVNTLEQHPTTGQNIKAKLQATGTSIKEGLQTTGAVIKDKAQATGTVIKEKLGIGQTQQNTVDNSHVTVVKVDLPQL
jgi:uncharacterized protein (TIGR02284 family)